MKLIMDGIQRLEQEVMEINDFNIYTIFNHIKDLQELQDKFDNEEKTIKGMYEYIYDKAKSLKQGNVAMVNDRIVFLWAINYFKLSNEDLGIREKKVIPPSANEVIKKLENSKKQEDSEKKDEKNKNAQISMFSEVSN